MLAGGLTRFPTHPPSTISFLSFQAERLISVALVPLLGAAFVAPGPVVDMGLAVALPLHNYLCVVEDQSYCVH